MSRYGYEPARSYDLGTHLWSIGSSIGSPEMQDIEKFHHPVDRVTAELGFNQIDKKFNEDLLNFKP